MKTLKRVITESEKVFKNVIDGCFIQGENGTEFDIEDVVILGLLENIINHSKTTVILLESNHFTSLDTVLRTIFENYVYLKFILEKDTQLRAKSYTYSTKIKELGLLEDLAEDSLDGFQLRKFLDLKKDEIKYKLSAVRMDEEYKKNITDGYLNEIGMKRLEQKWYNLDGKTNNFKKLCLNLGLFVEYNLTYSILSIETHGKDAIRNFHFEENRIDLIKMEKSVDLYHSMNFTCLMESVSQIYEYYSLKKPLKNFNTLVRINYKR